MAVRATKTETYKSPSSSTASTELERLEALSTVRPPRERLASCLTKRTTLPALSGRCRRRRRRPTLTAARTLAPTFPQVVPDVLLSQSLQKVEEPKAATSSRSVLAGIMGTPTSMRRFKVRLLAAAGSWNQAKLGGASLAACCDACLWRYAQAADCSSAPPPVALHFCSLPLSRHGSTTSATWPRVPTAPAARCGRLRGGCGACLCWADCWRRRHTDR